MVNHGKSTNYWGNLVFFGNMLFLCLDRRKHQDRFAASPCKEREEIDDSPCRFAAESSANIERAGHRG